MKLWEILPQLQEGKKKKFDVTFKDGSKAVIEWDGTYLWHTDVEARLTFNTLVIKANYEIIPQFIPFEEALAELRKGKTICCEYDKKLKYNPHWSGEVVGVTIAPDSPNYMIDTDMILNGKWWVVD